MVVPTVVHKGDASIDGAPYQSNALLFIRLFANVIAAETNRGYSPAGVPESAIGDAALAGRCRGESSSADSNSRGSS
jgi:hypothetical protein